MQHVEDVTMVWEGQGDLQFPALYLPSSPIATLIGFIIECVSFNILLTIEISQQAITRQ